MRTAPEGNFDVIVSEDLRSLVRETIDDGVGSLRANQQELKQESLAKQITGGLLADMEKAKMVEDTLMAALQQAHSQSDQSTAVGATSVVSDEEDESGDDGDHKMTSSLLDSLIGFNAPNSAHKKAKLLQVLNTEYSGGMKRSAAGHRVTA